MVGKGSINPEIIKLGETFILSTRVLFCNLSGSETTLINCFRMYIWNK